MTSETASTPAALMKPQLLKGFQDHLPQDAILRNTVIEKVRKVYERYGFLPIETPALEYLATLVGTGGEDANKELFRLKSPEHEDIALRFDLTVPFARIIAQYSQEMKLPFRRYHLGSAWRAEKPGPGRFREFTQFDFDAAGSPSMAVDAEVIRVMCDVMTALDVSEYLVIFNHRKIVDALLSSCGIADEDQHKHVLRVIDKLAKVGLDEVRKELGKGRIDESGDPIRGVGLGAESIALLEKFLSVAGDSRAAVLDGVRKLLPESEETTDALAEVEVLIEALENLEVEEQRVKFTPSLARGLDYYTGPVFETAIRAAPRFGSIMGGGRFDGLVKRFLGMDIPATGASIGIDRFLAALKEVDALPSCPTTTAVLVTVMAPDLLPHCLSIATEIRQAGINTEVYLGGPGDGLRSQLALANSRGIPIAVILGEDEIKAGTVAIKDLQAGMEKRKELADRKKYLALGKSGQVTVPRAECVKTVGQILGID